MLAPYQAYSRLYQERLGPLINKEWADSVSSQRATEEDSGQVKPIPPVPINFRNATLKRLLLAEPPEIRAEIEEWRKAEHGIRPSVEASEVLEEDDARFEKAEQYHRCADQIQSHVYCIEIHVRAQQVLASTIQRILENIEEQTGLIGIFTVVGPQPVRGGNIGAMTCILFRKSE